MSAPKDLGWLSPTGEFIKCGWGDHTAVADEIVRLRSFNGNFYSVRAEEMLLHYGWAKITMSLLGFKSQRIYWDRHLTPEQIQFLRPYFDDNPFPVDANTEIQWEKELDNQ